MDVALQTMTEADAPLLANLFQFYIYELSDIVALELDATGRFPLEPSRISNYWKKDAHWPFLIVVDEHIAGFCLLRKYPQSNSAFDIDQFFVMKNCRGKGVGRQVLDSLTRRFPGSWVVRVMPGNHKALRFWTQAVQHKTQGNYQLTSEKFNGQDMVFLRFEAQS